MITVNSTISLNESNNPTFLEVAIDNNTADKFIPFLQRQLSEEDFINYRCNQERRDNNTFHVTVVTPIEFPNLKKR